MYNYFELEVEKDNKDRVEKEIELSDLNIRKPKQFGYYDPDKHEIEMDEIPPEIEEMFNEFFNPEANKGKSKC